MVTCYLMMANREKKETKMQENIFDAMASYFDKVVDKRDLTHTGAKAPVFVF